MDGSIQLSAEERKTRRKAFCEARAARRAVVLLPPADGWSHRAGAEAVCVMPSVR